MHKRFEDHFIARGNVIYERAKFNQRKQEQSETVDTFITSLYKLAENCAYNALKEEMIRDCLVVGLKDTRLSKKLQLDANLTLAKAITMARQSETVEKQQATVRQAVTDPKAGNIDHVKAKFKGKNKQQSNTGGNNNKGYSSGKSNQFQKGSRYENPQAHRYQHPQQNQRYSNSCGRCGKSPSHPRMQCPARDATCTRCSRRGHYGRCCRTQQQHVGQVREEFDDRELLQLELLQLVISQTNSGMLK